MSNNTENKEAARLERMRIEHSELLDRYIMLERFTLTEKFLNLPKKSQNKLIQQGIVMHLYLRILRSRIMDCVKGEEEAPEPEPTQEEKKPHEQAKEDSIRQESIDVKEFDGWRVFTAKPCDKCYFDGISCCKKLILAGGSHICVMKDIEFRPHPEQTKKKDSKPYRPNFCDFSE